MCVKGWEMGKCVYSGPVNVIGNSQWLWCCKRYACYLPHSRKPTSALDLLQSVDMDGGWTFQRQKSLHLTYHLISYFLTRFLRTAPMFPWHNREPLFRKTEAQSGAIQVFALTKIFFSPAQNVKKNGWLHLDDVIFKKLQPLYISISHI